MTSLRRNEFPIVFALTFALATMTPSPPAHATPGDYTGSVLSWAGFIGGSLRGSYLVGSPGAQSAKGRVDVYYGSDTGDPVLGTTLQSNEFGSAFGRALAWLGDVNSDSYYDVAIGQPLYSGAGVPNGGRVWIYLGGPAGLIPGTGIPINGTVPNGQFGSAVTGAGDVNSDGHPDLLVGAPYAQRPGGGVPALHGEAYLFYGSATGIVPTNPTVLTGTATRQYRGFAVSNLGDFDGDGYGDVAVGAPGEETDYIQGRVYLYRGSAAGLIATPAESLTAGSRSGRFGAVLAAVFDRDGDYRSELLIGSPNDSSGAIVEAGRVFIRRSTAPGTVTTLLDGTQAGAHLGAALADAGDIENDALGDILIGEPDFDGPLSIDEGRAHLLLGNGATHALASPVAFSQFGLALAGVGAVTPGYYGDFVIGAPGTPAGGAAILFRGENFVDVPEPPAPATALSFLRASPNPTVGVANETLFLFAAPPPYEDHPGPILVTVHDARGRFVRTIDDASYVGSRLVVWWNGRDAEGRVVRPGVYFARATFRGQTASGRVVRL